MPDSSLHHGDCLEVLRGMASDSVDSIVTDPPYGLSFMGRKWDYDVPAVEVWAECLRVLKPGGHLLAFAGTRTQHRMACRIEDGGFEIRDMLAWLYGSGFPKHANALKPALEPITLARKPLRGSVAANVALHGTGGLNIEATRVPTSQDSGRSSRRDSTACTCPSPEAGQTPRSASTQREVFSSTGPEHPACHSPNAPGRAHPQSGLQGSQSDCQSDRHFCGGPAQTSAASGQGVAPSTDGEDKPRGRCSKCGHIRECLSKSCADYTTPNVETGRWPANLLHDGSPEVVALFPVTAAANPGRKQTASISTNAFGDFAGRDDVVGHADNGGSAARYFYCAKASKRDRDEGLDGFEVRRTGGMQATADGTMLTGSGNERTTSRANIHPTVKPTDLMRYLCRLVTPPGGVVLDPFMGSGSTGKAAALEGFRFIGIEREAEYVEIARARIGVAHA